MICGWLIGLVLAAPSPALPPDACVACHSDPEMIDPPQVEIPARFREDVHAEVGLTCVDCHGGNARAEADDMDAAMDAAFAENPYRGAPARKNVSAFCGRCHSDPEYMKRFRPDARVDQEAEYRTSRHGKGLALGDSKVAVCVDCHGAHGIFRASDKRSSVHPARVAETCARCHADAKRMAGRKRDDGTPLPIDQHALWGDSVHAKALLEREDLSAPTCNDCHGNHGAAPPGVDSVAYVCGRCHAREAELFRKSPKHRALEAEGKSQEQCIACHSNHAVLRPTVAMLSPLPETPCAFCHEGALSFPAEAAEAQQRYRATRDAAVDRAAGAGLAGVPLFDALVADALSVPFHLDDVGAPRPEFARLYSKFRIGAASVATAAGTRTVVRCSDCHEADDGADVAAALLMRMRDLTGLTARAERTLLAARRGGIEVGAGMLDVDAATDAQIELEVAVHTFSVDTAGAFAEAHGRGIAAAVRAQEAGAAGLAELSWRRKALVFALGLVGIALVAIGLKIRSLPPLPDG